MQIDLNKLRTFAAIYEVKSITKASAVLHVTPSAISQSLSLLESELGFILFQRISKKLVPTAQGDALFEVFKKSTSEIENCVSAARSSKKEISGTLKIGAPPEFGSRQVIHEAAEFFKYENAKFEMEFGLPDDLLLKVITQELDFAFCDAGPYLKKYSKLVVYQQVFEEEAILVCSKAFYARSVNGKHTFEHLSKLPHSDYRPDKKVIHLWYQHHFGKTPLELDLRISAGQVNAMIQAALHGVGLVFIPSHLIETELKTGKLVEIPTKKKAYVNPIMLVQKADKVPGLFEKNFIDKFLVK